MLFAVDRQDAFALENVVDLRRLMPMMSQPPADLRVSDARGEVRGREVTTKEGAEADFAAYRVRPGLVLEARFIDDQSIAHAGGCTQVPES
jgi:hypothetical protein